MLRAFDDCFRWQHDKAIQICRHQVQNDLMKKLSPCQLIKRDKSSLRWLASKQLQFLIVGLDIIKNSIR